MLRILSSYGLILRFFLLNVLLASVLAHRKPPRGRTNAIDLFLYENKDMTGERIQFSTEGDDLDHLDRYFEEKGLNWNISLVCVERGVFLLFKEEYHDVPDADSIVVVFGKNRCFDPPGWPIPPGMGSVRSAHDRRSEMDEYAWICFYVGPNYQAPEAYDKLKRRLPSSVNPLGSMMIMADRVYEEVWELETTDGTFCFDPLYETLNLTDPVGTDPAKVKNRFWLCLVPNITELLGPDIYGTTVQKIRGTCADVKGTKVNLTNCYDYETGDLVEPAIGPEPEKNKTTDAGNETSIFYGLTCENSTADFSELAFLIRMRVTNDFDENYQFLLPLNKQFIWRTELFDSSMEVVAKLMEPLMKGKSWFLGAVREYFLYFTEKFYWISLSNRSFNFSVEENNRRHLVALHQTRKCLNEASSWKMLDDIQRAVEENVNSQPIDKSNIHPDLRRNETYNPLIEYVWLSVNLVGAACHHILGHTTNYWLDYGTLASQMYLAPLAKKISQKLWQDGDNPIIKYYPIIFGGANLTREYDVLAVFTTTVYKLLPRVKVLSRSSKFIPIPKSRSANDDMMESTETEGGANAEGPTTPKAKVTTTKVVAADAGATTEASEKRKKRQHSKKTKETI